MEKYREFIEKFDKREKEWLVELSKYSKVETNLRLMKQMNVGRERADYVRQNIHRLDLQSRLDYDDALRAFEWRQQYIYAPSSATGISYFIYKLATKPPTKSLAIDGVAACIIALVGWAGSIRMNNTIYAKHINKYFKDIVITQIDNKKS